VNFDNWITPSMLTSVAWRPASKPQKGAFEKAAERSRLAPIAARSVDNWLPRSLITPDALRPPSRPQEAFDEAADRSRPSPAVERSETSPVSTERRRLRGGCTLITINWPRLVRKPD
jgi:hypothetical protein